jgi:hypothetical protein
MVDVLSPFVTNVYEIIFIKKTSGTSFVRPKVDDIRTVQCRMPWQY